jgi:hypothetical protein
MLSTFAEKYEVKLVDAYVFVECYEDLFCRHRQIHQLLPTVLSNLEDSENDSSGEKEKPEEQKGEGEKGDKGKEKEKENSEKELSSSKKSDVEVPEKEIERTSCFFVLPQYFLFC